MGNIAKKLLAAVRGTTGNTRAIVAVLLALSVLVAVAARLHVRVVTLAVAASLSLFAVTALCLRRARFDRFTILIVLGGLWLYLGYLSYTDYGERNYDGGEQLRYVQYIVEHHARPPATYCLICHHPPLYYAVGAAVYAFFERTHLTTGVIGLQLYGLVLQLVFVGYAAATARRLVTTRRELHLATALVVFWPYSIENAVRVHNDTLAATAMGVATFYLVRWTQGERRRDLYLAAIFTGVGLLTKLSAYVMAGALVALLGLRFFRSRDKLRFARRAVVALLILVPALALNAAGKETPTAKDAPLCHRILGNACDINKGQWVENHFKNYVYLDLKTFLREPYALAERDGSGRAYFWNTLLKSSLLGTHNTIPDRETAYELNRGLAYGMNGLFLGMNAYLLLGAARFARRRELYRFEAVIACLASALGFMIGFRVLIPAPHHTDFRHIFSVLALTATLYAATAGRARTQGVAFERAGRLLAIPFLVLSILYFVPKHDWAIRVTRRVVQRDLGCVQQAGERGDVVGQGGEPDHRGEPDRRIRHPGAADGAHRRRLVRQQRSVRDRAAGGRDAHPHAGAEAQAQGPRPLRGAGGSAGDGGAGDPGEAGVGGPVLRDGAPHREVTAPARRVNGARDMRLLRVLLPAALLCLATPGCKSEPTHASPSATADAHPAPPPPAHTGGPTPAASAAQPDEPLEAMHVAADPSKDHPVVEELRDLYQEDKEFSNLFSSKGKSMLCGPTALTNVFLYLKHRHKPPFPKLLAHIKDSDKNAHAAVEDMFKVCHGSKDGGTGSAQLTDCARTVIEKAGYTAVIVTEGGTKPLPTPDELRAEAKAQHATVLNFGWFNKNTGTKRGGHWVALAGYDAKDPNVFYVTNPLVKTYPKDAPYSKIVLEKVTKKAGDLPTGNAWQTEHMIGGEKAIAVLEGMISAFPR